MRKGVVILYTAARVMFAAAVFYWFFLYMGIVSETQGIGLSPVCPLLGISAVYIAGFAASGRGVRFWPYAALQAVVSAAGAAWTVWSVRSDPRDIRLTVFCAIAYLITAGISARSSAVEIRQQSLTARFDVSVILCVLLLLTGHYTELALLPNAVGLFLAAMLLSVIALTVMRSGDGAASGSAAGRVLPFVLIVIIGLVSLVLYMFAAGGAGKLTGALLAAIKAVWHAAAAAIAFVWTQWTRFCGWLSRFFEPGEMIPVQPDTPPEDLLLPDYAEPSRAAVIVLYVMTALLVIALLAAVYYALRNIRLRRKDRGKLNNRKVRRKGSSLDGLKAAAGRFAEKLRYRLACARFRNTPAGLLAWCEKKVSKSEKIRTAESGPQFLLRLASSRGGADKEALTELAELVEKDFYSSGRSSVGADLCAAVRRCRL